MNRVLIVENEFVSRRVMERALIKYGYEVTGVSTGAEAWEHLLAPKPPTILILNLVMPDMNGLDLVARIRGRQSGPYVFIIILTSKSEKADIILGIETGADDYLTKPFYHGELLARVRAGGRIVKLELELAAQNARLQETNSMLSATNVRMKHDLEAASRIQQTLLPRQTPQIAGINIAWRYQPCDELGGDILNIFMLDQHRLGLYLLDVSGHGVSAALLSVTLSRLLTPQDEDMTFLRQKRRNKGGYEILPPGEVADRLNKSFQIDDETQQYFTLIYGILDLRTYKLAYVSAGHPNLLRINGTSTLASCDVVGLPIGFSSDEKYETCELQLERGDRVYFYSDGVKEAMNHHAEPYGDARLLQFLSNNLANPLKQTVDDTLREVDMWTKSALQDDISILAIELAEA